MTRCRLWRFNGADDLNLILPVGKNHQVWRPCHRRAEAGTSRCRECADSLITCPETRVRRALVREFSGDHYILEALVTDPDPQTAQAARDALDRLTAAPTPTPTSRRPAAKHTPPAESPPETANLFWERRNTRG